MKSGRVINTNLNNKTLFVSSPISQICLALSVQFKSDKDTQECIDLISELSTNSSQTETESFDIKLSEFLQALSKDKNLIF